MNAPKHLIPDLWCTPPFQQIEVDACDQVWLLERTADMESLWEAMDDETFNEDERMPYWAELWPASFLLARQLSRRRDDIKGKRCLDIGCGLGLTAIIASSFGASVTAFDNVWPAAFFGQRNAQLNKISPPLFTQMDWCFPAFKPHAFDFMWGGDIVYETRFYEPLRDLFLNHLAPTGEIWLGEPVRSVSRPVWERLASDGFLVENLGVENVPVEGYHVTVNLWRLTKPRP